MGRYFSNHFRSRFVVTFPCLIPRRITTKTLFSQYAKVSSKRAGFIQQPISQNGLASVTLRDDSKTNHMTSGNDPQLAGSGGGPTPPCAANKRLAPTPSTLFIKVIQRARDAKQTGKNRNDDIRRYCQQRYARSCHDIDEEVLGLAESER